MTDWFEQKYECWISDVFASGMITCEKGLYELPHIEAPVSVPDLAAYVAWVKLPQISDHFDFYFVPGIKFTNQKELGTDMMRGEETEIAGAIDSDDSNSKVLVLHFGSHNKLIGISEGKISHSITTIAGELISAVCRDTILKDILGELNTDMNLDAEFIKKG
jgi:2-dehydro-3-deoxygalactonokinase